MPRLLPLLLKYHGASNQEIALIVGTIATALNTVITPVVSFRSDRYRSRLGRRNLFRMVIHSGVEYRSFCRSVYDCQNKNLTDVMNSRTDLVGHCTDGIQRCSLRRHTRNRRERARSSLALRGRVALVRPRKSLRLQRRPFRCGVSGPAPHWHGPLQLRRRALVEHLQHRYRNQPPEQMGGVKETIANYLHNFLTPDIAQVFCPAANTFQLSDIDRGKIICVAMPQKFQTERRYVNTFLKMLFYTHILRRFDRLKQQRKDDNLLILWADEAQRFMTSNEDGMSDYNSIDVIREANAAVVAAAQSSTSFIPPLGKEKAKVLTLNLRNRMIFKAADEEGALESADFLGKKRIIKKTWGYSAGQANRSYAEHEEHKIKPHILRSLPKHTAVLVHCERGHKRTLLPPIEPNGQVSPWFRRRWF